MRTRPILSLEPEPPAALYDPHDIPRIILCDAIAGEWRLFVRPCEVIEAARHEEVMPCLRRVEELVESGGLHAAGFVSYEAAPAFDSALTVHPQGDFPLLWFGLFRQAETIVGPLPAREADLAVPAAWEPSVTAAQYAAVVARLRAAIAAGETYQVNYTFRLRQAAREPWDLFVRLVEAQRPPHAAYLETARYAICSASPELFFRLDGSRIVTRPMKGTLGRGRWYEEDLARAAELQASVKNRAENAMIVDMMRNDLGRIARVGSVRVDDLFRVERYPTLWQMTSSVSAETEAPLAEIFAALFPCASVTGAPKPSTMRIIAGSETAPRRIYTGSIGHLAPGRRAEFNVAIRTVLVDKDRHEAEYGVGGGVVWDSTAEGEYDECVLKARILTVRQPEFDLLETLRWTGAEGYWFLPEHLERLRRSAEYFGFRFDARSAEAALNDAAVAVLNVPSPARCDDAGEDRRIHERTHLAPRDKRHLAERDEYVAAESGAKRLERLPGASLRVRLLLSRSGSVRCEATPFVDELQQPVLLELAAKPVDPADVFLYHKTTHRQVYEAACIGCDKGDDVLLFNTRGEVTETCRANIVVRIGEDLWTPPIACGLLPGTHRARLLAEGRIRERVVLLEMLARCDEIFFVNSVRGMQRAWVLGRG